MNVWKIGSRWGNDGPSVLDVFRRNSIVFVGEAPESIQSVKVGDLVAVTDGISVVAVGIVKSKPCPITEFEDEIGEDVIDRLELDEWVTAFRVLLFDLDKEDVFPYNQGKFHKVHNDFEKKIINLLWKFLSTKIAEIPDTIPYSIRQINIFNFKGINNIYINNIPSSTRWIFLTGENGFGKTSVLQAIVIGLIGITDENTLLDRKEEILSIIEIQENKKSRINILNDNIFEHFAAYGPSRLSKSSKVINNTKSYSIFNSDSILQDIEDKLKEWEKDENQNKYYKSAKSILLNLLSPLVDDVRVNRAGTKTFLEYHETESVDNDWKQFNEIASGCRNIIALFGDMIIRLSENQPLIDNFNNLEGIVLIDEIDNHLHPKWQKALVEKLTELFPKIQFIASTHSPIPFLGAPKNSVFITVDRKKEEGITAQVLDIDVSTLLPNSILTSPLFGFQTIIPTMHDGTKFIETEDDYQKILENKKIDAEIEQFLNKERMEKFMEILNSSEK